MSFFYGFVRTLCIIVAGFGFRVKVEGLENIKPDTGYVLCCNHQSFWDMPILIAAIPVQIHFMAKKEIFKNKLFSAVLSALGIFPVSRGEGDLSAIKKSIKLVSDKKIVGVFPQGTRKPLESPEKIKAGSALIALQTKSDILPAALNFNGKIKLFGKVNLKIGKSFSAGNYIVEENSAGVPRKALKAITKDISKNLVELWEN